MNYMYNESIKYNFACKRTYTEEYVLRVDDYREGTQGGLWCVCYSLLVAIYHFLAQSLKT